MVAQPGCRSQAVGGPYARLDRLLKHGRADSRSQDPDAGVACCGEKASGAQKKRGYTGVF
jgi:hypothetical protein